MQSNEMVSNSLFLIFMGSMDCLTTVIGTMFFQTQELNPVLSGLVRSDLSAFVFVKLSVTVVVGLIFILAQKTLNRASDKTSTQFKIAMKVLKAAYLAIVLSLAIVVTNNILVLLHVVV